MPLYEYQCDACAHRFEVIQKFSDPPIEVCPKCGGTVGKLLSSPAIQFKGSGWYITDYARSGKTDTATTGSGKNESSAPSKEGSSSTDGKGDGKADAKSETAAKPSAPKTSD